MTFIASSTGSATGSPVFDYSSRDYTSVINDLIARIPVYLPEWTSRSTNDFGIVLLQMFAYCTDILSYYLDRLVGEAFLQTATQPQSVLNIAAMLNYIPTLSTSATVLLQISISNSTVGPLTIPAGTQFSTVGTSTQSPIVFEAVADLVIVGQSGATPSFSGVVNAIQQVTYTSESVVVSNGVINQIYPLQYNPVAQGSWTVFVDVGNGPKEWTYVSALVSYGPSDQVYTNFVDANGIFYIVFGDNVNGMVPPLGSPITATYSVTQGLVGNVGPNTITQNVSAIVGFNGVINPNAASGGANPESINSIRVNAPAALKSLNRGVTVSDIQSLTLQVPGVQWASAQEVTYQLVNLYIMPFGGGYPTLLLESQVSQYLDPLVMANTTVTILNPTYVPINVTVNVTVLPTFGNTATQNLVIAVLNTLLSPNNTGFGFRISLSLLYQLIMGQAGVNYAEITVLNRSMLTTLTSALVSGDTYTSLSVSQLPQQVNDGDSIVINPGGVDTQIVTANGVSAAGAYSISVGLFTANANYAIETSIQDTSTVEDCVLLANEIPIVGIITVNVVGGLS